VDLSAEVERLRSMLDRVPACLLRVAHDGTLLAANDAALSLLGGELTDVLGSNFVERLDGQSVRTMWAEFVDRVAQGGSASFECELIEPGSDARAVVLLGTNLLLHPDNVPSIFVAVRHISAARRLEASLHEQERLRESVLDGLENATASLYELRRQLADAQAQRDEMQQVLTTEAVQRQRIAAAVEQLSRALGSAVNAAAQVREALEAEAHP
jgi:PAS domain-containing protein